MTIVGYDDDKGGKMWRKAPAGQRLERASLGQEQERRPKHVRGHQKRCRGRERKRCAPVLYGAVDDRAICLT